MKECIGEGDRMDVIIDFRFDDESQWQFLRLARSEGLLRKAEAIDFLKMLCGQTRRNARYGLPNNGFVRTVVYGT